MMIALAGAAVVCALSLIPGFTARRAVPAHCPPIRQLG